MVKRRFCIPRMAVRFCLAPPKFIYSGIPPTPPFRLARAEAKPRRPARSEQSPAKKFSFPFRRKKSRAK